MGILDIFKNKKTEEVNNKENQIYTQKFLQEYYPSKSLEKPNAKTMEFGKEKLPKEIVDLWKKYGFGNYGSGMVKIINPTDYMSSFYKWLGKEDFNKIPIVMTAFGDLFFYDNKNKSISFLDIHYRTITECTDYKDFFDKFLVDENIKLGVLKQVLFNDALKNIGSIKNKEIYFFVPALVLGGNEDIKHIKKGDALVHQHLLFDLGK